MSMNMNVAIAWGKKQVGRITYSMYGSRYCTDGTCDCSGFVYRMIREGGGSKWSYIPSTETLHAYLTQNGFQLIAENKDWNMQKGDVVIWGKKGYSAGAGGHTGICIDHQNWLECTAYHALGVTIQNHDDRFISNGCPYFYVYRLKNQAPNKPKPEPIHKTHDQLVAESPVKTIRGYAGKLEYFNVQGNQLVARGWLTPINHGTIGNYGVIIFWDQKAKKEITRGISRGIQRPDVIKAYHSKCGNAVGLEVKASINQFKGKKVSVILRRAKKRNGEESIIDIPIGEIYLTL